MFWNCISKQNYNKVPHTDENCEVENCADCLVKELIKENWQKKSRKCDAENCIREKNYIKSCHVNKWSQKRR